MRNAQVATFRSDIPASLGVFDTMETSERTVYCTVRSVSWRERYEAETHGLRPEIIIKLAVPDEWQGESVCLIAGVEYRVMHPYTTADGGLELTLERRGAP